MKRVVHLAAAAALIAVLAACERSIEPTTESPTPEPPAPKPVDEGVVLDKDGRPLLDSKGRPVSVTNLDEPDLGTVEGQPGGFLTFRLPSKTKPAPGTVLAEGDPLRAAFLAKAAKATGRLRHKGRTLEALFVEDPKAASLWRKSISTVLTAESDPAGDGTWLVIVQARLRDLILYLRP